MNKQFTDAYFKEVVNKQDPYHIGNIDGYSMALRDCIKILSNGRSAIQQIYLYELKGLQDEFLTKVEEFGMLGNYREYLKKKWEEEAKNDNLRSDR